MTRTPDFLPGDQEPFDIPQLTAEDPFVPIATPFAPTIPSPRATAQFPVTDQHPGWGVSSEANGLGQSALTMGIVAVVALAVLWIFGVGITWLIGGMSGGAMLQGVRGQKAADRGLATNGGMARVGLLMGIAALLGTLAYAMVLFAIIITVA